MTSTLIGIDSQGAACVKIAKGNLDPVTTPDSQIGAWMYNSKWAADIKLTAVNPLPWVPVTTYRPAGAGPTNFTWHTYARTQYGQDDDHIIRSAHYMPALEYNLPLHDVLPVKSANGRFVGGQLMHSTLGHEESGGVSSMRGRNHDGWYQGWITGRTDIAAVDYAINIRTIFAQSDMSSAYQQRLVLWRLPGDDTPIKDGVPKAPVTGQDSVQINSTVCRVAKPGYDVRTATPTQLAFDSAGNPAKVIAAGDVAVPWSLSFVDLGFEVPPNTVANVCFYDPAGPIHYPVSPVPSVDYGAEYWFADRYLWFDNQNGPCRARYIVLAFDDTPPTSGDNDPLRQLTVGGENVVQFLRPGSGNPPSFADIVLDSRWPCLQIVKEGYIPVTADGPQSYSVDFDGAGIWPFVKYTTVHGAGVDGIGGSWTKEVRTPQVRLCGLRQGGGWARWTAGNSTHCALSASQAVFYSYRGAPITSYYLKNPVTGGFGELITRYDPAPIQGIRYYILGIPQQ